ncbi:MAG: TrmB family transcriptional regulator [Candidatus Bathyarchaeota archaeon]|nr:MAG: TrmB family transcriptional regulator [Candidatus Bathyarchaeota archaeon]
MSSKERITYTNSTPTTISARALLRRIKLTKYEAYAYLALIKYGPLNCKSLTRITGIPNGKIYTVMKTLVDEGWAQVSTQIRPKRFYPVDPEIAIMNRIETLREGLNRLETSAKLISHQLKTTSTRVSYHNQSQFRSIRNNKILV